MMKRLRCTYTQLQAEPALEMAVFEAFAEGEMLAERAIEGNKPK